MEQIARAEMHQPTQSNMRDFPAGATRKFWSWVCDEGSGTRTLYLDGVIAEESWFDDDVTPKAFKAELYGGEGDIVIWLNSPGGDCIAASQIYAMLMDYRGDVTVKIDGIAASAASVIAMAGTKVLMAPTALMMVHNPLTVAIGDSGECKGHRHVGRVKEASSTPMRSRPGFQGTIVSSHGGTWLNANKVIEMALPMGS